MVARAQSKRMNDEGGRQIGQAREAGSEKLLGEERSLRLRVGDGQPRGTHCRNCQNYMIPKMLSVRYDVPCGC